VTIAIAVVAFLAVACAIAWPHLHWARSAGISASDRAGWVNRLFVLAALADAEGQAEVAAAARALIAALVGNEQKVTRGR